MLKTILKFLISLVIGMAVGLLIATVLIVSFTDMTFAEFMVKLKSAKLSDGLVGAGVGIIAFIVSIAVLVIIHEAGHLVCGLLSGYRFVSFRIFNFTIIKIDGKLRVRKYSIAGTGGQCLLTPPSLPLEKIPTGLVQFRRGAVQSHRITCGASSASDKKQCYSHRMRDDFRIGRHDAYPA